MHLRIAFGFSTIDRVCSDERYASNDAATVAKERTRGVQGIQTPRLGEPPKKWMVAKANLRHRAAAASEKDDRCGRAGGEARDEEGAPGAANALSELVEAIRLYRKLADSKPLTLQGDDYAKAVERLNGAVDRADGLVLQ